MNKFMVLAISLGFATQAHAISNNVRFSCVSDYLKHCWPKPIDSEEVKECFRSVGKNLQPDCIAALKEDGMITDEDKAKAVEETPEVKVEEPVKVEEAPAVKTEPIVIGDPPKNPEVTKNNVLQNIAKRVAAKLRDTGTKIKEQSKKFYVFATERTSTTPVVVRDRKVQQGGKWDGYPLYLDWNNNRRNLGGELTPYGLEDRN